MYQKSSLAKNEDLFPFEAVKNPRKNGGFRFPKQIGEARAGGNGSNHEEMYKAAQQARGVCGPGNEPQDTPADVAMPKYTQSQTRKQGFFKLPDELWELKNLNLDLVERFDITGNTIIPQWKKTAMNDGKILGKITDLVHAIDGINIISTSVNVSNLIPGTWRD